MSHLQTAEAFLHRNGKILLATLQDKTRNKKGIKGKNALGAQEYERGYRKVDSGSVEAEL